MAGATTISTMAMASWKNQITSGEFMTDAIVSIDDKARVLYLTGNGKEPNEDPYYDHLYRVNFDGSAWKLCLRPEISARRHCTRTDGKFFIDTFSRVDTAPKTVLLDQQGAPIADVETTDVRRLLETGYKYPEPFHVKADDGITDIYGVMWKPFDFDPNKKYPLVEYVYPGAQTESVDKTFTPRSNNTALSNVGIIVIEVGNRVKIRIAICGTKLSATTTFAITVLPIRKLRPNNLPGSILILISIASESGDTAEADS